MFSRCPGPLTIMQVLGMGKGLSWRICCTKPSSISPGIPRQITWSRDRLESRLKKIAENCSNECRCA